MKHNQYILVTAVVNLFAFYPIVLYLWHTFVIGHTENGNDAYHRIREDGRIVMNFELYNW